MKTRCYNESDYHYKYYGERGIEICDEWKNDFEAFYNWAITNGYNDYLSIDRIDNDGNYEPSNCRWATQLEQVRNKSDITKIAFNGETKTISEWAEIYGINPKNIYGRYIRLKKKRADITEHNLFYPNRKTPRKSRIFQFTKDGTLIKRWENLAEIEKAGAGSMSMIRRCCIGKCKSAYGYIWKYAD